MESQGLQNSQTPQDVLNSEAEIPVSTSAEGAHHSSASFTEQNSVPLHSSASPTSKQESEVTGRGLDDVISSFETLNPAQTSETKEKEEKTIYLNHVATNTKIEISSKAAMSSKLISTTLSGDKNATEIDIGKGSVENLERVVRYLTYHDGRVPPEISKPLKSTDLEKVISDPWDLAFLKEFTKKSEVYDIITLANYMDVNSLLHLMCALIASRIKGKHSDEIRTILESDEL